MPSPVTDDSIPDITGSAEACESMAAILEAVRQLKIHLDYEYTDEGLPEIISARELGAIIWPPGTLRDIVVAVGTSAEAIIAEVEKTWLTEEEIDAYNDDRDSVDIFWSVANLAGRDGAPNLSGRFKLTADFRPLDSGNVSGVVGVGSPGGSNEVTLTVAQLAKHTHTVDMPTDNRFVDLSEGGPASPNKVNDYLTEDPIESKETDEAGGGEPHTNMPPYFVVVTAWRTSRMS